MSILFKTLARLEKENGELTDGFADVLSLVEESSTVELKESRTAAPEPPAEKPATRTAPAPPPRTSPGAISLPSAKPARQLYLPAAAKSSRDERGVPTLKPAWSWHDKLRAFGKMIGRGVLTRRHPKLRPLAISVFAGLALFAVMPKIHARALLDQVRHVARARQAVALDANFRDGLDNWISRGNTAASSWSVDAAGFAHPGKLALYRPTLGLVDYQMQFVGTIDRKALSWVVRAADFDNYYVVKLSVLKPGPLPAIGVTRYAVINGKVQSRAMIPLIMNAQLDTVYRVRVDVHGDNFVLSVQDQRVDSWSEPGLQRGGIGFFSEDKSKSRVIGVSVTGRDNMLSQLFAR